MYEEYKNSVTEPFSLKTVKKYYKLLYPNLRKMKSYEDYCTICFELERDIVVA